MNKQIQSFTVVVPPLDSKKLCTRGTCWFVPTSKADCKNMYGMKYNQKVMFMGSEKGVIVPGSTDVELINYFSSEPQTIVCFEVVHV